MDGTLARLLDDLLDHAVEFQEAGLPLTARHARRLATSFAGERRVLGFRVSFLWGVLVGVLLAEAVRVWWAVLAG